MRNRTLFLHIGAPKAASTTLQKKIFPKLDNISFINKPIFNLIKGKYDFDGELSRFLLHSAILWDHLGDRFFIEVQKKK